MFYTESVEKLVKYALLTGFVKSSEAPLSLMLISPPESAKTSILRSFYCLGALEVMDLSPKPLCDVILPKIKNEHIHHIIIPDLIKVLAHKIATVNGTVAMLNAMIEEGVKQGMFYGQSFSFDEPIRVGIITSVTPEFFHKFFRDWNDMGFASRFIPVSYKYSDELIAKIHKIIKEHSIYEIEVSDISKGIRGAKNGNKIDISIEENAAAWAELKAQEIAKKISTYRIPVRVQGGHIKYIQPNLMGFRLHKQIRLLVKAIALSKKKREADMTDIAELNTLLEYIGYPNQPKLL